MVSKCTESPQHSPVIPCRFIEKESPPRYELTGFCDASVKVYSVVIYLRVLYNDNGKSIFRHIITSKTKIALIMPVTILPTGMSEYY